MLRWQFMQVNGLRAKEVDRAPQETLDLTAGLIHTALREREIPEALILGMGVGIASPVDKTTGALVADGIMPVWIGVRPGTELERRTGLPATCPRSLTGGSAAAAIAAAWKRSRARSRSRGCCRRAGTNRWRRTTWPA
jgi:predicted NBD/HSP70 family sugar kinase